MGRPSMTTISTARRNGCHEAVLRQCVLLDGLTLYEARPDKVYSLTDCISMQVMRREGLTDVLTNDHHFTQEGFHILFP